MYTRTTLPLMTILAATGMTGCYSTWDINPRTLIQLDGFQAGQKRSIVVNEGETIDFDQETEVHFHGKDGIDAEGQFSAIHVDGPVFTGTTNPKGELLHVDLSRMSNTQVTTFSGTKTGLAVAGIAGGAVLGGLGMLFLVAATAVGGRPLRLAGQTDFVRATLLINGRRRRAHRKMSNEATRQTIFQHWAKETSAECASIPAFLALARDLKRSGAPRSLVNAALQAARDEARHTELCSELANMHSDAPILAMTPPTPEAVDVNAEALLERLVLEAFWDGCVAEGTAAIVAQRSRDVVRDETTRLAVETIARDEANHAELAKQIVAYGLSVGGASIRRSLRESFESKRADEENRLDTVTNDSGDDDEACKFGLAGQDIQQAARIEAWEKSVSMMQMI